MESVATRTRPNCRANGLSAFKAIALSPTINAGKGGQPAMDTLPIRHERAVELSTNISPSLRI
jgi:hypothetical protein